MSQLDPAYTLANELNVTHIPQISPLHAGLRQAEARKQAVVLATMANGVGLSLKSCVNTKTPIVNIPNDENTLAKARQIATFLNVTDIDTTRSAQHAALRHAEIGHQAELIAAFCVKIGLYPETMAPEDAFENA